VASDRENDEWMPPSGTPSVRHCSTLVTSVRQCGLNIPNLLPAKAESLTGYTASSATQCRSNPVSGRGLPKTGIFQISAGDYQRFRSHSGRFRSPETDSLFAKARHWRAFLSLLRAKSPVAGLAGWGGRIRTLRW
jgi:hypothetical protein